MYRSIIDNIKDKNICILGFGKEGISTYNFIRRHLPNKKLTIIDKCDVSSKIDNASNVNFIYGSDYLSNLDKYDLIIKTPGISLKDINIENIKDKLTSQLELILEVFKKNIIGITGTKGKSTTSSLIYKILKDQGYDTYLLGNIGNPMFDDIEFFNEDTYLVIEMSAHQLEFINISPHIAIVLNLFEDHLDHAGSVYHYHQNKMNIFKYQNEDDYSIYSIDNENILNWMNKEKYLGKKYCVTNSNNNKLDTIHINNNDIILNDKVLYNKNNKRKLIGDHNLFNIMFSLVVSNILNLDIEKTKESISCFNPLRHRMEYIGTYNDILYYDDAIATIPMATINAIESLKYVDTLVFGGMDRGIDYSDLINYLHKCSVNNLICMPKTGYDIGNVLEQLGTNKKIYYIESLKEAVKCAKEITKKGTICLLSPAASSYEYFKNFEEKGDKFAQYVKEN